MVDGSSPGSRRTISEQLRHEGLTIRMSRYITDDVIQLYFSMSNTQVPRADKCFNYHYERRLICIYSPRVRKLLRGVTSCCFSGPQCCKNPLQNTFMCSLTIVRYLYFVIYFHPGAYKRVKETWMCIFHFPTLTRCKRDLRDVNGDN